MTRSMIHALAIVLCAGGAAGAQEVFYDAYGRPIIDGTIYNRRPPPGYGYQPPPPPRQYYEQPAYSPYAPPQRRSRYQQGNACATPYGSCELPGPMFVGRGCKCSIPGVGRVAGTAVEQ